MERCICRTVMFGFPEIVNEGPFQKQFHPFDFANVEGMSFCVRPDLGLVYLVTNSCNRGAVIL